MSKVEISFDGVGVGGHEFYPKPSPGSFPWAFNVLQAHYSNREIFKNLDEILLLETVRSTGGATFIYYQYLHYRGMRDTSGRDGSVFGITIAADFFIADIEIVLSLCRDIFQRCVIEEGILKKDANGNYSWKCQGLSNSDAIAAYNLAEQKMVNVLRAYDLQPINITNWQSRGVLGGQNTIQILRKLNPSDVNPQVLEPLLKEGLKVAISDAYPTKNAQVQIETANREREVAERKVSEISRDLNNEKNKNTDLQRRYDILSSEKDDLSQQLEDAKRSESNKTQQLKTQLKERQRDIDELNRKHQEELSKYKAEGNYSCQNQLNEIRDLLTGGRPETNVSSHVKSQQTDKPLMKWIAIVAAAIIMLLLGVLFGYLVFSNENTNDVDDFDEEQMEYQSEQQSSLGYEHETKIKETKIQGAEEAETQKTDDYTEVKKEDNSLGSEPNTDQGVPSQDKAKDDIQ